MRGQENLISAVSGAYLRSKNAYKYANPVKCNCCSFLLTVLCTIRRNYFRTEQIFEATIEDMWKIPLHNGQKRTYFRLLNGNMENSSDMLNNNQRGNKLLLVSPPLRGSAQPLDFE